MPSTVITRGRRSAPPRPGSAAQARGGRSSKPRGGEGGAAAKYGGKSAGSSQAICSGNVGTTSGGSDGRRPCGHEQSGQSGGQPCSSAPLDSGHAHVSMHAAALLPTRSTSTCAPPESWSVHATRSSRASWTTRSSHAGRGRGEDAARRGPTPAERRAKVDLDARAPLKFKPRRSPGSGPGAPRRASSSRRRPPAPCRP